jgi:hypothetical protein
LVFGGWLLAFGFWLLAFGSDTFKGRMPSTSLSQLLVLCKTN